MGTDIVSQAGEIPGLEVVVAADIEVERARNAFELRSIPPDRIHHSQKLSELNRAVRQGEPAVTENGLLVPRVEDVDVVMDATGVPELGAELGFTAIQFEKHIVMMNVEADVVVGPILRGMADRAGVVYTGAAGDEPAAVMELYNFARNLGFEVVAAGKGKNNPMDPHATPDDLARQAKQQGSSVSKLTSVVDGTNTMIEMTAVSNATGLPPDVEGMHGPDADVDALHGVFSLDHQGGILSRKGVVDYTVGGLAPGVFLVFTTENPRLRTSLEYNKMGSGPNYLLYRPYHLISLESVLSAARAELHKRATMVPMDEPTSETVAVAKQPLSEGERLDGIGGRHLYGRIVTAETARENGYLPLGLARGGRVKREVDVDSYLTRSDVRLETDSFLHQLRSMQDQLLGQRRAAK